MEDTSKYVVVEIQTDAEGNVSTLVHACEGRDNAASVFHQILSYAAISALPCHGASWLNSDGSLVDWKAFRHEQPVVIEE